MALIVLGVDVRAQSNSLALWTAHVVMTTHSEPKGQEGGCAALGGLLSCRPSQTIRLLGFVSRRTTKAHDMRQLHCPAVRTFVPTKKVLKVLYTEAESPRPALEPATVDHGERLWSGTRQIPCLGISPTPANTGEALDGRWGKPVHRRPPRSNRLLPVQLGRGDLLLGRLSRVAERFWVVGS